SGHSMFDWPEHTQTSPTRTFLNDRALLPVMFKVKGPPDLSGPIIVCQCPPSSVTTDALFPAISTVTRSLGFAQPQIRTFLPCCKTMLSPMSDGTRTSADALATSVSVTKVVKKRANDLCLFIYRFGLSRRCIIGNVQATFAAVLT